MRQKLTHVTVGLLILLAAGCSSDPSTDGSTLDAAQADGGRDAAEVGLAPDTRADVDDVDVDAGETGADARDTDAAQRECAPLPPAPSQPVWPTPGEVFYAQLGLGGFSIGESALIVGPAGTVVAFDAANDSHDDDIGDALTQIVGHMSQAGFSARSDDTIDHVVITHYHADHADGIADLLERVSLTGRIVSRGLYDLTGAANPASAEKVCRAIQANPGAGVALCAGPQPTSCDPNTWSGTYPPTDCSGLTAADLLDPSDGPGPSFLPLGDARLSFIGANGVMAGESYADHVGPLAAEDGNGENARSLVALVSHGRFRMLLTGDLTGGGDGTDDVESFYAARLAEVSDIDGRGVDVLHAGHHGRKTSSNATWLQRLLPADGRSRNVVMGISTAHINSPHSEVLERIEAQGLQDGAIWTTDIAAAGDSSPALVNADGGRIVVASVAGGDGYVVQAIDADERVVASRVFAAATCPR